MSVRHGAGATYLNASGRGETRRVNPATQKRVWQGLAADERRCQLTRASHTLDAIAALRGEPEEAGRVIVKTDHQFAVETNERRPATCVLAGGWSTSSRFADGQCQLRCRAPRASRRAAPCRQHSPGSQAGGQHPV